MHTVPVVVFPILIVALVVAVVRRITIVAVIAVAVLFVFSIAGRPLFAAPGTVSLPIVRTTVVVLFAVAFAIFVTLLIGGTVLFIGRVPNRLVGLRRG